MSTLKQGDHFQIKGRCTPKAAWLGIVLLGALNSGLALAQRPPVNGMRPVDMRAHAIVDATVIPAPGQKIERATIVIRNGAIEAVGPSDQVALPADARVWKAQGMTVYAGLIESALLVRAESAAGAGAHWNPRIRPEISMAEQSAPDPALRKDLRALGFAAAAVFPSTGAIRGTGAFMALADENEHVLIYRSNVAMAMAFDYGGGGRRGGGGGEEAPGAAYPGSLMGAQALLRQAFHDARWYRDAQSAWMNNQSLELPLRNDAMEAMGPLLAHYQRILFDASDELNALRAAKLLKEAHNFGTFILLGSGLEFRQLNEILALNVPIIVPLEFPKRPDVSTLSTADAVSLRDMQTWEQAPTNARRLVRGGADISLTSHRLRSRNDFHTNLRTAIKHGLTEDEALAALTTNPARLMNMDHTLGTIEPGKIANLVVVKGSLFDKDGKIYETWVNGRRYEVNKDAAVQLKGSGTLNVQIPGAANVHEQELKIDVDTLKSSVTIHVADNKKVTAKKVVVQQDQLSFISDGRPFNVEGYVRFSGVIEGHGVSGTGAMPDGSAFTFTITITPKAQGEADAEEEAEKADDAEAAAENADKPADRVSGEWTIRSGPPFEGMSITMTLRLDPGNVVSGVIHLMEEQTEFSDAKFDPATGKLTANVVSADGDVGTIEATIAENQISGTYTSPQITTTFTGTRAAPAAGAGDKPGEKVAKDAETFVMPPEELAYPLGEYGRLTPPEPQNVLVRGATIWTSGSAGIIKEGDLHMKDGKIAYVGGTKSWAWGAGEEPLIISARGKHITPGLIDCHSHTGINGGVNEFAQTNTAECRIADCIDPTAVNWYRQLAGGLTACNQLHGSANPIGGQNSVVKLKFGAAGGADAFPIADAIAGIKFALGENVKRSPNRYPNTRMGVETFIRDAFTAAREYKASWERYDALAPAQRDRTTPPRRDLELQTLVEILDGTRLVHCHSYRQDEILMLIRVAEDFGFTIGTFQHVLEGYKVAEAIGKHGAGASSFSDWWAYKIEVMDAIPHNGTLMNNVGVLVSFNSDSDELARRMNTEAAKAVRYGGCAPEEALKFVTINPARQLRIDRRTGSLENGKDADFVIWSGDPLSTYTVCEQTWIEGARYFDIEEDQRLREQIHTERQRLIQKILVQAHGDPRKAGADDKKAEGAGEARPEGRGPGGGSDRPRRRPPQEIVAALEEQVRMGRDPDEARPGVCGCSEHWMHAQD